MAASCKDCTAEGITSKRKTPHPGPRCASHHRVRRTATRATSWERRLIALYGITAAEYWEIYEYQDGTCAICQRATGARKRLSVDHCHKSGLVRGLLCNPCNKSVLGHLRDDPEAIQRAYDYVQRPPAPRVIGLRLAPIEGNHLTQNGEQDD